MTYDHYRAVVDAELRASFDGKQGMLYDMLRYHLGWVDERGNPADGAPTPRHGCGALALAAAVAVAGDCAAAAPVAAAVELAYNFVLVHNDVQAGRIDRRNDRPSIWWVWGPSQAINAGDGLHALARAALMRLSDQGIPAEGALHALRTLDQACLTLCEGQYMDLTYQDQLLVSEADYMDMIRRKAGALPACAAHLGGLAAGAAPDTADALRQWGEKLGMARQIYDDIADLWGRAGDGLTPGNLLNKKKSLPLIHALQRGDTAAKRELGGIYMKRALEPDDARRIIAILDATGARGYAAGQASRLANDAAAAIATTAVKLRQPDALARAAAWMLSNPDSA